MRAFLLFLLAWPCAADYPVWMDFSGMWKIHAGNNPEWAQLNLDDSDWSPFQLPRITAPPQGFSWLRRRFDADPASARRDDLVLTVGSAVDEMTVFLNGRELGASGRGIPGYLARTRSFPVPAELIKPGSNVIAIRIFYLTGGAPVRNILGYSDDGPYWLTERSNAPRNPGSLDLARREKAATPDLFAGAAFATMAVFVFLIWTGERSQTNLVLLALLLGCTAANQIGPYISIVTDSERVYSYPFLHWGLVPLGYLAMRTGRFRYRWLEIVLWVQAIVGTMLFFVRPENRPFSIQHLMTFSSFICLAALLRNIPRLWNETGHETSAIALPLILSGGLFMWGLSTWLSGLTFFVHGYKFPEEEPPLLLLAGLMISVALRQMAAARREKDRLAGELEAARSVQQLLIPAATAQTKAFRLDAVYEPAQEVGGDFYWTRVTSDGSLLLVTGDVSGKGLKAAMLVSVVVGTLRNEMSEAPGAILQALNRTLLSNTGGGFVTCCCGRFDPDGTMVVANAGNPVPWCNGREIEVESSLPLGVLPGAQYAETAFSGDRFTFVSDGVLEASNRAGELFGFERTGAMSTKPANEIAEAARAWGQNDDITVVTVRRRA
jgi:hypothetical protein